MEGFATTFSTSFIFFFLFKKKNPSLPQVSGSSFVSNYHNRDAASEKKKEEEEEDARLPPPPPPPPPLPLGSVLWHEKQERIAAAAEKRAKWQKKEAVERKETSTTPFPFFSKEA